MGNSIPNMSWRPPRPVAKNAATTRAISSHFLSGDIENGFVVWRERYSIMDAKISALEKEYAFLQKKREAMLPHMESIFNKVQELRRKRDEESGKLDPQEEIEFRRAMTVVGELLERQDNLFGGLSVVDEEPDKEVDTGYSGRHRSGESRKYSIHIRTNFVLCVCPGLRVYVTIKTKTPAIKRIVQDMVESTEYVPKEAKLDEKTNWGIDWDYHDKITIKNKMSSEKYYKEMEKY